LPRELAAIGMEEEIVALGAPLDVAFGLWSND
jgi:hypothetical protein